MKFFGRYVKKIVPCLSVWVLACLVAGCAGGGEDLQQGQLLKQQAATIESLNAEVVRLNQEVDDAIYSRRVLLKAQETLTKQLSEEVSSGDLTIALDRRGLVFRFLENALYEPEKMELRSSAQASLDKIADVLMGDFTANKVFLEGHTDDAIPAETGWRSSWEYTNGMAAGVLHYFVDVRGLNPARFSVISCAEYQKVDPRDTDDGRERNRRVEIIIAPQKNWVTS